MTPESPNNLDDAKHVLVTYNPKAGARSGKPAVEQLVEFLNAKGLSVEIVTDIDELQQKAKDKLADGCLRAVVAAGGDGTAALVANRTEPKTPIAVLPLGTENLLSKYLGIRSEPEAVADVIVKAKCAHLDAGSANGQLFLLMVGCGFDAEVVRRLHEERTGHIHHLSYAKPILDSIRKYEYPELRITCETETGDVGEPIRARWLFVVNLPKYAGGLNFVPDADGSDGLLDVCAFKEGSLLAGIWYLGGVITGQHQTMDDCITTQTRRLRIEADEPVPFQMDGDPGGYLPADIEILPKRLTLLVPEKWAEPAK